ncbi:DUF485 domain-containing protein [Mumia quercus]|uniref:DUF485 domain-containing protein n=1 Tax=Mumia quercus TaxID=2976125 RepID=UPI0021D13D56|nr:DUF485 domain-containing protein [Mumia quercus]
MIERTSAAQDAAYERIHATEEFRTLKSKYLRFVVPVTIGFMAWYLLYVVCSNWAPDLMGTQVVGNINVALVFGLLQFVTTFAIAIWYSRYSVKNLDPVADKLRAEFDEEVGR